MAINIDVPQAENSKEEVEIKNTLIQKSEKEENVIEISSGNFAKDSAALVIAPAPDPEKLKS